METPPAWSLMFTGMIVGLAIGVFGCFLFYLSGNVPPLNLGPALPTSSVMADTLGPEDSSAQPAADEIQFEFYQELQDYEVGVDATPVELAEDESERALGGSFMLQTGAFEQQQLATIEMRRQQALGLEVMVKRQSVVGRTLYLVQSGPYQTNSQIDAAERLLRSNNIPSIPIALQ